MEQCSLQNHTAARGPGAFLTYILNQKVPKDVGSPTGLLKTRDMGKPGFMIANRKWFAIAFTFLGELLQFSLIPRSKLLFM